MKITNRIAGEWQSFDEGVPPEGNRHIQIACMREESGLVNFYYLDGGRWMNEDKGRYKVSYTPAELAEEYDAFCVIKGPWE